MDSKQPKLSPRAKRLLEIFYLTEAQWQTIKDFQGGLCAICKHSLKKANVDHDHSSGLVRGLLCARCNRALGRFGDSLVLLRAAVKYLESPPAVSALGYEHKGLPGRVGTKKQRKLAKRLKREKEIAEKTERGS